MLRMTQRLARSCARDAANFRMRSEGRSRWNAADWREASLTFARLWPPENDRFEDFGDELSINGEEKC